MNLNNKNIRRMNNALNNLNNNIEKCVNNDIISTVFIILVIFYSILIAPTLNFNTAKIFDNIFVRIILITCIIGLGVYDPIKALLLAIAFVISIQRLYKLKVKSRNNANNELLANNNIDVNNLLNNNMDSTSEEQDINILNNNDLGNIINLNTNNNVNNTVPPVNNNRIRADNIGSLLNDTGMTGVTNPRVIEPFVSGENDDNVNNVMNGNNGLMNGNNGMVINNGINNSSQINIVNIDDAASPINVASKNDVLAENVITGDPFNLIPTSEDVSQEMNNNFLTTEANEINNEVENNSLILDNVLVNDEHPAFQTLTDNVITNSNSFTSKGQLLDAQSNIVPSCSDQSHQQKTFNNQHGTQGLDHPLGALRDTNLTNYSSRF